MRAGQIAIYYSFVCPASSSSISYKSKKKIWDILRIFSTYKRESTRSRAIAPEGIIDIFAAAGLKEPDISILSDDFLQEVRQLPHRNLAVELLRKLLNDEIKTNSSKNVVQARSFAEMLEKAIRKYQNRAIEAAQVIEELIKLAKEMREAQSRGENLGMSD